MPYYGSIPDSFLAFPTSTHSFRFNYALIIVIGLLFNLYS